MIPKKIHYIWLGKKVKSKLTEVCINSWRRNLPDYEIIEWNENNLELQKLCETNIFLRRCCELGLWAFVSDYIRLYILYQEGGIYLDTDVEVVKSYDVCLSNSIFMGYEKNDYVGTAVIGAEKGNKLIARLLEFYKEEIWNVNFVNNPIIFRYLLNNEPDIFSDCKIYKKEYFSPYDPEERKEELVEKEETISIHWYTRNWNLSCRGYAFLNTKHIKNPVIKQFVYIKKMIGYLKQEINAK